MEEKTKQILIIICAVFVAITVLYYIASPYQNCVRNTCGYFNYQCDSNAPIKLMCLEKHSW